VVSWSHVRNCLYRDTQLPFVWCKCPLYLSFTSGNQNAVNLFSISRQEKIYIVPSVPLQQPRKLNQPIVSLIERFHSPISNSGSLLIHSTPIQASISKPPSCLTFSPLSQKQVILYSEALYVRIYIDRYGSISR
jgi:hypothetical protein